MPAYNTKDMLAELARETQEMLAFAEELKSLSAEQMHWKPSPKKWSVAECLAHLNIYAKHYLTRAEKKMNSKGELANPKDSFHAGYWGEKMTVTMKPLPDGTIPSPMKTAFFYDPANKKGSVDSSTLSTFISYHKQMLDQIKRAHKYDLEGIKVMSTLGPLLMFKLGDVYRFMVAHDQRHLLQSRKVISTVGFPK